MIKTKNVKFFLLSLISLTGLFVLYYPALGAPLFSVDDSSLIEIPQLQSVTWNSLKSLFQVGNHIDYYPIRDLSYLFDYVFFSSSTFWARTHQLILFWVCSLGLGFLSLELGFSLLLSFSFCSLWLFHPYHSELILWLSARKDILALLFGIWTCFFFVKKLKTQQKVYTLLTFTFFVLSLLSKATFLLLPWFALIAYLLKSKPFLKHKTFIAISCALSLVYTAFQTWFYSHINPMDFPLTLSDRFLSSLTALGRMICGWIIPSFNTVDIENIGQWFMLNKEFLPIGFSFLVLILLLLFGSFRKKRPDVFLAISLFAVLYLPISGLLFPHLNFYSTRYFEAPALVIWGLLAFSFHKRNEITQKTSVILVSLFITIFIIGTFSEAQVWREAKLVRKKALDLHPQSLSLKASYLEELINIPSKETTNELIQEKAVIAEDLQKRCQELKGSIEAYNCRIFYLTAFQVHVSNKRLVEARNDLENFKDAHSFLSRPPHIVSRIELEFELLQEAPKNEVLGNFLKENSSPINSHYRWLEIAALCLLDKKEMSAKKYQDYKTRNLIGFNFLNTHSRVKNKMELCLTFNENK